ncbi:hypothetical protein RQP46_005556 [Phenoliferia psychrophenolica]
MRMPSGPTARLLFIEIPELEILSRALNLSTPTLRISTRIEVYSCKEIKREKKLFKALETELIQEISHSTSISPPEDHQGLLDSAFGPLDQRASRKMLYMLIGLLNVAFPDHDFSSCRPEEFSREGGPSNVLRSLSAALDQLRTPESQRAFSSYPTSASSGFPSSSSSPLDIFGHSASTTPRTLEDTLATNPFLQRVLDPVIDLANCECFTYNPGFDSDPHAAESDDESDSEDDANAYEGDDMPWEMEGLDSGSAAQQGGPSWKGGYGTPMRAYAAFRPPGTPTGSEDWSQGEPEQSSSASLLWSSHHFLYNSIWGSSRNRTVAGTRYKDPVSRLKRRASAASNTSLASLDHESKKARA